MCYLECVMDSLLFDDQLKSIHIPQLLHLPARSLDLQFKTHLKGLDSLTPVQGWVQIVHQDNYLDVSGKAETIMTLSCHRCLCQYNHRVKFKTTELIWLSFGGDVRSVPAISDGGVEFDELTETLPDQGNFDVEQWIYEQLCLAIPSRQLCDANCRGIAVENAQVAPSDSVDQRWAALELLKHQLSN